MLTARHSTYGIFSRAVAWRHVMIVQPAGWIRDRVANISLFHIAIGLLTQQNKGVFWYNTKDVVGRLRAARRHLFYFSKIPRDIHTDMTYVSGSRSKTTKSTSISGVLTKNDTIKYCIEIRPLVVVVFLIVTGVNCLGWNDDKLVWIFRAIAMTIWRRKEWGKKKNSISRILLLC